jgi:hypothetical protein
MDSHLLEPKDANTEPLSRANPTFQEANTQMPLKKPTLFMTKHPTQQGNLTTTIMHQLMVHQA